MKKVARSLLCLLLVFAVIGSSFGLGSETAHATATDSSNDGEKVGLDVLEVENLIDVAESEWQLNGSVGLLSVQLQQDLEAVKLYVPKHILVTVTPDHYDLVTTDVLDDKTAFVIEETNSEKLAKGTTLTLHLTVENDVTPETDSTIKLEPVQQRQRISMSSVTSNDEVVVTGGGFGHRVGMSQWGAQGLANLKATYDKIVAHYYPGTKLVRQYDDTKQMVNAHLNGGAGRTSWTLTSPAGGVIYDGDNKQVRTVKANERLQVTASLFSGRKAPLTFKPNNNSYTEIPFSGSDVRRFDGTIRMTLDGTAVKLTNHVPLRNYLIGVVPRESYASWNAEALKAQAIAARTYAASRKFSLVDTTAAQVYGGRYEDKNYASKIQSVVTQTNGLVLTYNGALISAVYSSSNGGWIESNVDGFGASSQINYLQARRDVYRLSNGKQVVPEEHAICDSNGNCKPHGNYRWERRIKKSVIENQWPAIGKLERIQVVKRTKGYGATLTLTGSKGKVTVTAREFRSKLGASTVLSTFLYPLPFSDIEQSSAKNSITALAEAGIIAGHPDGTFKPNNPMTRAQFAKILASVLGLPDKPEAAKQFTDVHDWAKGAVGALVDAGLAAGETKTRFGSDNLLSRQDMAVFFVRALGYEDKSSNLNMSPTFRDARSISNYAKPHVAFASEIGLINGYSNGNFGPFDYSKREQVAHLAYEIYAFANKYHERANKLQ